MKASSAREFVQLLFSMRNSVGCPTIIAQRFSDAANAPLALQRCMAAKINCFVHFGVLFHQLDQVSGNVFEGGAQVSGISHQKKFAAVPGDCGDSTSGRVWVSVI